MSFGGLSPNTKYDSDLKSEEEDAETIYSPNATLLSENEHPSKHSNCLFLTLRRGICIHLAFCVFNALLVLIIIVVFRSDLHNRVQDVVCTKHLNQPSPALEAVEYEVQQFKAGLKAKSVWSEDPGAEVDKAWHNITETGYFGLPEEAWKSFNPHLEEGVKLPNGQYLATLDVYHKLHCLDILRRAVHFNYYHDKYPAFINHTDATINEHLGHCIEILRINVMCEADVTVMTYNWVENRPEPMPYFDTVHTCRKWERISEWMDMADLSHQFQPEKPVGQKELPRD